MADYCRGQHGGEYLESGRMVKLGVDQISGGLMHKALQAIMTNALLIITILNLVSRRRVLFSIQFYRNVINMDMKKVKGNRI